MSYEQAVDWQKAHPGGTRQTVIMSTGSGFWPSLAWLDKEWWPYVELCAAHGFAEPPLSQEEFYELGLGSAGWLNITEHLDWIRTRPRD